MDVFDRYKNDDGFVLATHVFANVSHFRKLLSELPWNSQPDWIQWGLLEATLVKARAIADFLITDTRNHVDDFGARSMLSGWIQPESDFIELRELVNKQVAHFAQQRFIGESEELEVSVEQLIRLLEGVENCFIKFETSLKEGNPELFSAISQKNLHFDS